MCFCKLHGGLVWLNEGEKCFFFTFYRGIYYFLAASEAKCLLYRILGVCIAKTNKKKGSKT